MIADIALALSIINSILWVVLIIVIKRIFNKLMPMLGFMGGIAAKQNLTYSVGYDKIGEPEEIGNAESGRNISA